MIRYKTLLNPLILFIVIFVLQFIIFLIFFDYKYFVTGLESVPKFLELKSILIYLVLFSCLLIGIMVGEGFSVKSISYNEKIYFKLSKIMSIIIIFINLIVFISCYNEILSFFTTEKKIMNFAQLKYETLDENPYRTFINFLIYVVGLTYYYKEKDKFFKKLYYLSIFILFMNAIFLSQRMSFMIALVMVFIIHLKKYGKLNKILRIKYLLTSVFLLFIFVYITELLRYGLWNSYTKNIDLISYENLRDVFIYLMVAYLSKDVNNALIAFSSEPVYSLFSTGSKLFYSIVEFFFGELKYQPIIDSGPHGTVNFLALIWIDWGYFSTIILFILGVYLGFLYKFYLKTNKFLFIFLYALSFCGIISSIRINFFFLNSFIYNLILVLLILVFTNYLMNFRKNKITRVL